MLKIKEDKMQELEKFGFKKCQCPDGNNHTFYVYFYDIHKNYGDGSYIQVEIMPDRSISLIANCNDIWTYELDILYELFANDMIEKVVE